MSESTSELDAGADEDSGAAEDALFEDPAGVFDGVLATDGEPQPPHTHWIRRTRFCHADVFSHKVYHSTFGGLP